MNAVPVRDTTCPGPMATTARHILRRLLILAASVLVLKVTLAIVLGYRDYFPPNFSAGFLLGREPYFFGAYQWAFYTHIVTGPTALALGLLLVNQRLRTTWPRWHRRMGNAQILLLLCFVVPSGLWMAPYAMTGAVAALGFAVLSVLTGLCVVCGWRAAVARRFADHRRWMWRCFLLLCSAVVLRLIGGLATVLGVTDEWPYSLAAWVGWLGPLAINELADATRGRQTSRTHTGDDHGTSVVASSPPAIETIARR